MIITDYGSFINFLNEISDFFVRSESNELHIICSKNKVININDKTDKWPENLYFHFIEIPRGLNIYKHLMASIKIYSLISKLKPHLVHIHFTTASFTSIIFKNRNIKYWTTIHGLGMNATTGIRKFLFTLIEHFIFYKVDKIFVLNNEDFNYLKSKYNSKIIKIKSFGLGCDINKFSQINYTDSDKKQLRRKFNIPEDVIVISFTGRFVNFKGFHILIKIFIQLCKLKPGKFRLLLIGGIDSLHKTGLNKEEEDYYNNSINIINVGFTNNVEKYLSISNFFIFPSKKEGLPICVLESLSMAVPVIAFNSRGNNDIIKNNYNGILVPMSKRVEDEVQDFVNAINNLLNNKYIYNQLQQNANLDRLKYSRNNFISESIQHYNKFAHSFS
jgi:glycosyltransferase involved in cell wall biosynthesis